MAVIEALETVYLEADVASVTIDSINQGYETLIVHASQRSTNNSGGVAFEIECNGTTTEHHTTYTMVGANSSELAQENLILNFWKIYDGIHGTSALAPEYATMRLIIPDYAQADTNKSMNIMLGDALTKATDYRVTWGGGNYDQTSHPALTQLRFRSASGNLTRGSEYTLFGVKNS